MVVQFGKVEVIGDLDQSNLNEMMWIETTWEWVERIADGKVEKRDHRQLIQEVML